MSETSRMHYVSQTYLRKFATQKGKEFYINAIPVSATSQSEIFQTNVSNVCLKRNIYKLPGETMEERQAVENFYNKFCETNYDNIHKMMLDKNKTHLSPEERQAVIGFIVAMFFRNISWHGLWNKRDDFIAEMVYNIHKKTNQESVYFEDREIMVAGKSLDELKSELRNDQKEEKRVAITVLQVQKIIELINIRVAHDIISVTQLKDDNEFITCDNPVICKQGAERLFAPIDPRNTLSIAIDNKHMLELKPVAHELDYNFGMIGRVPAKGIFSYACSLAYNGRQLMQSSQFLLGTSHGLQKWLNQQQKHNLYPKKR